MSQKRLKKVQKALDDWGVDAFLVTDPIDLYYLSDVMLSLGSIVVTKKQATLIVDNRYYEKCQNEACLPVTLLEAGAVAKQLEKIKKVGFSQETLSYGAFHKLQSEIKGTLVPLEYPMQQIRAVKETSEIAALEKAIALCYQGIDFVKKHLRTGVTEQELAKKLEIFWLTHGADKFSFDPIIAFGKNSSMPHYRAGSSALKPKDVVLVDIGVVVNGYASDMTRTFFFGKPDPKLEKIYDVVLQAQEKSLAAIKPEVSCAKLYEISKKVIDKAGFGDKYLHGLGHGIGLETHEYPSLKAGSKTAFLAPGMCITIEPGIYLPNVGGIRIEDMALVTKDGHRNLTLDYPKTKTVLQVL